MHLKLFVIIALSINSWALTNQLKLKQIAFSNTTQEISGLFYYKDKLLFVADDDEDKAIFSVDLLSLYSFKTKEFISLKETLPFSNQDFEGLSYCKEAFYLVAERRRQVLKVTESGKVEILPIHYPNNKEVFQGGANAGFEGIAIDCELKILYIAKERDPREIIVISLEDFKIKSAHTISEEVKSTKYLKLSSDFSDLSFYKKHLYVLSRNERSILKIEPSNFKIIEKKSYSHIEDGLYLTGEPYGIAEGLAINDDVIAIGFDNNKKPLSQQANKKYGAKGSVSSIALFEKPKDF